MISKIFKVRAAKVLAIGCLALFLGLNLSMAELLGQKDIPLPEDTQKIKQEKRQIAGMEFEFISYISGTEVSLVKDFYRSKLIELGWQEKDVLGQLDKLKEKAAVNVDSERVKKALEENLMFDKGEENMVINFIPGQFVRDNKTHFIICRGTIDPKTALQNMQSTDYIPKLLDKPKKEIMPVYPDSSLLSLSEDKNSLKANYIVKEDIALLAQFYKDNMPRYGWSLAKESPLEKVNTKQALQGQADYCPSCPRETKAENSNMEILSTELIFSNESKDTCKVMLSYLSSLKLGNSPGSFTVVIIDYAKKTK
ncbi:MAG: hypothetical protein WC628_00745 [Candidatus Omnitrophota bacterium]